MPKPPFYQPNQSNPGDLRNLILTVVLCTGLLYLWQVTYLRPQQAKWTVEQAQKEAKKNEPIVGDGVVLPNGVKNQAEGVAGADEVLPREEAIKASPRVRISAPALHGSINLKGLRFDDLTLVRHRTGDAPDSPEVVLLSPSQSAERYFAQIGWLAGSSDAGVTLPDSSSLWQADHDVLEPSRPVTLSWTSPEGVRFGVEVAVDDNYLFTLTQTVENQSGAAVKVMPYGLINRARPDNGQFSSVVHEGPIATIDHKLTEFNYATMEEKPNHSYTGVKGWLGLADKYWLTAFIPAQDDLVDIQMQYMAPMGNKRVQVDYLEPLQVVASGEKTANQLHFFAGAKELDVLENYQDNYSIPLFDRSLDFGVLYFLTYPIFLVLSFFFSLTGNFGLGILLLVVLLKTLLFPIANKSYTSMAQMKTMTPELERIKKTYEHDKLRMQQETMALWKREKINPMSGCLPILIQLPIFFSLYKVLLVTIEMRHAPFYGWISDLSAPDPSNLFTLFGLVEWNHPSWMHLGLWPIIMAASMILQQRLSPKPSDPVQAKVIGLMPYIFLIMLASFPAGLVIYWAWNNILSMIQQWVITRRIDAKGNGKKKAEFLALD